MESCMLALLVNSCKDTCKYPDHKKFLIMFKGIYREMSDIGEQ